MEFLLLDVLHHIINPSGCADYSIICAAWCVIGPAISKNKNNMLISKMYLYHNN